MAAEEVTTEGVGAEGKRNLGVADYDKINDLMKCGVHETTAQEGPCFLDAELPPFTFSPPPL